ncbi:MAG: hypothetical protein RLN60_00530 [Phycisphaerales bacterium]
MPIPIRACFLAILALFHALGCAEAPGGGDAATPSESPRLAVLSPASAIILRDLGHEDTIVARHGFDLVLDTSVPVAGDQTGIDYETLIRLEPTDVILERGAQEPPARLLELAGSRGWTVHEIPLLTLPDVRDAITQLERIASPPPQNSEGGTKLLADLDAAITDRPDACTPLGRTLLLTWTDPVGVMGPGSFHFELLSALGATPIPNEGAPYITLDTEDVLRLDPDTIVLLMPGHGEGDLSDALGPLVGVGLRAVEEERVILINHPLALTPSTALIDVADALVASAEAMR